MRSVIFLTSFILLTVLSCSKDDRNHLNVNDLQGIWYNEDYLQEYNRISRLEYNFKSDNTLEVLRLELSNDSGNILGYRFRTTGNYSLSDDQILFYNLSAYINDDTQGSCTEIADLKLIDQIIHDYTVTCKIEDNGSRIVFIFPPCGPAANCIGSISLLKQKGGI